MVASASRDGADALALVAVLGVLFLGLVVVPALAHAATQRWRRRRVALALGALWPALALSSASLGVGGGGTVTLLCILYVVGAGPMLAPRFSRTRPGTNRIGLGLAAFTGFLGAIVCIAVVGLTLDALRRLTSLFL